MMWGFLSASQDVSLIRGVQTKQSLPGAAALGVPPGPWGAAPGQLNTAWAGLGGSGCPGGDSVTLGIFSLLMHSLL